MHRSVAPKRPWFAATVAVAFLAVAFGAGLMPATATHTPANKMSASSSHLEVLGSPLAVPGQANEVVELLQGRIKTSKPTDLIFSVSAECALWTDLKTVGTDDSSAAASVKLWIEVNGVPVRLSRDEPAEDAGKVVFCDRAYRRSTIFEDENATIETFLKTRSANAFDWIKLNVGSGTHDIVLKAELATEVAGKGHARAAVGKRTMLVTPEKLANDATL